MSAAGLRGGRLAAAALATLALTLAGCGGDEPAKQQGQSGQPPAPKPAPKPPTKAEVAKRGDAICRAANARADRNGAEVQKHLDALATQQTAATQTQTLKALPPLLEKRVKIRAAVTEKLEALPEPAQGGPTAYLAARKKTGKLLGRTADVMRSAKPPLDQAGANRISKPLMELNKSNTREQKLAKRFGFKVCGKPRRVK